MDKFNYACTYVYVRSTNALQSAAAKLRERVDKVVNDESGMEIIAVILILVIVLGIAVVFREQITTFVNKIFKRIGEDTGKLDDGGFVNDAAPVNPADGG